MSVIPTPLPENAGLAFTGETAWPPAVLTLAQWKEISGACNPAGRPNSDVLRSFVGQTGRRIREHWQIDFPAHYTAQEAALHERPFDLLRNKVGDRFRPPERLTAESAGTWWINPHAQPPLRQALARLDRFLATALDAPAPAWTWFESEHLPDDSLLVVARDDDFTHAVLQSHAFAAWWRAHFQKGSPTQVVASFPFPWPPFTPLGSLTRVQQDHRSAVSRATLSGDAGQVVSSVAVAFGWPVDMAPDDMLAALSQLNEHRAAAR